MSLFIPNTRGVCEPRYSREPARRSVPNAERNREPFETLDQICRRRFRLFGENNPRRTISLVNSRSKEKADESFVMPECLHHQRNLLTSESAASDESHGTARRRGENRFKYREALKSLKSSGRPGPESSGLDPRAFCSNSLHQISRDDERGIAFKLVSDSSVR